MSVLRMANIYVIQMQHARIMLAHTHVHAMMDSVETELCARDIDECATHGQHTCHSNATCSNNAGSYVNAIVDSVEMERFAVT